MAEAHLALQNENVKLGETLPGRKESNTAEDWVPDYPGVMYGRTVLDTAILRQDSSSEYNKIKQDMSNVEALETLQSNGVRDL